MASIIDLLRRSVSRLTGDQATPAPATPTFDVNAALAGLPAGLERFGQLVNTPGVDIHDYLQRFNTDPASVQNLSPQQIAELQAGDRAAAAERQRLSGLESRYLSDLSFLDPTFQRQAALLGPSAAASAQSDAGAIAAQQASYQGLTNAANTPLNFQSPAQQQALAQQWSQIQGGQGAPSFAGAGNTQQSLLDQIRASSSAPNAGLTFDTGARQSEQYGNLQGIIAGGGADTIEMARRQAQRADQEAWLRGQREADMQNLADRGMAGSGAELLALSANNQAAAGRNSLADLETAAALEQRRMDAINSAAGLASTMRGNTIEEQALLNNARSTNWNAAAGLANQMRSADYQEKTYLDERTLNALMQQTDLANTMRGQQATESIAQANNTMTGLSNAANIANQARSQTWEENFGRGAAADQVSQLNAAAINSAQSANQQALIQGQQQARQQQFQAAMQNLQLKVQAGLQITEQDLRETMYGYGLGTNVAGQTAGQINTANTNYNGALTGQGFVNGQNNLAAQQAINNAATGWAGAVGGAMDSIISNTSGMGGGSGGAASANFSGALTAPTQLRPTGAQPNYGTSVGGTQNVNSSANNWGVRLTDDQLRY